MRSGRRFATVAQDGDEEPKDVNELLLSEKRGTFRIARLSGYAVISLFIVGMLYLTIATAGQTATGQSAPSAALPLPQMMFVLLFGAILLNLTGAVFGLLEIHAASSGEQKYIIARHSYFTGLFTAIFAALFLVLIALLGPYIDGQIDFERRLELGYGAPGGRITAPFNVSSDYTGSSYLNWIDVNSTNGRLVTISVYFYDDYDDNNPLNNTGREVVLARNVSEFHFSLPDKQVDVFPVLNVIINDEKMAEVLEAKAYYVVVERKDNLPAEVVYKQDRTLDPAFLGSVMGLLIVIIIVNGASTGVNRVVRGKYRAYGVKNY